MQILYNESLTITLFGFEIPSSKPILSQSDVLLLSFTSDVSKSERGFLATYQAGEISINHPKSDALISY